MIKKAVIMDVSSPLVRELQLEEERAKKDKPAGLGRRVMRARQNLDPNPLLVSIAPPRANDPGAIKGARGGAKVAAAALAQFKGTGDWGKGGEEVEELPEWKKGRADGLLAPKRIAQHQKTVQIAGQKQPKKTGGGGIRDEHQKAKVSTIKDEGLRELTGWGPSVGRANDRQRTARSRSSMELGRGKDGAPSWYEDDVGMMSRLVNRQIPIKSTLLCQSNGMSVCLCVCVRVVCVYISMYTYMHIYICLYACMSVCLSAYMHACIHVCMC